MHILCDLICFFLVLTLILSFFFFFFFNDTATTEIYTLSLHDALPIFADVFYRSTLVHAAARRHCHQPPATRREDRKSTRLNSSHGYISYAVFCLKKKKEVSTVNFASAHMYRESWTHTEHCPNSL